MALFIKPQISSSHADLKSCTRTCPWHPKKKQKSWKIYWT